jgi:hypothetical protein
MTQATVQACAGRQKPLLCATTLQMTLANRSRGSRCTHGSDADTALPPHGKQYLPKSKHLAAVTTGRTTAWTI